MRKFITLLCVTYSLFLNAQFVNQLTYINTLTVPQVDSALRAATGSSIIPFTLNYGVKIYKVVYNTVDWDSNATTASGLLCVPVNPPCKVNIISYQHGTITRKRDAPSKLKSEWYIGLAAASLGSVCVLPDYLGLGSGPGLHPYQHAHTEATAVIDMIRSAKEVVDTMGSPVNDQLFLLGYSQGGHATMAAHQLIQEKLDNVMHVTASAPMSGAYDMSGVMSDVMMSDSTYPSPYYLPYLFFGYNEVYHLFTNDSDVMIHPYDTLLPPLFDGNHTGGSIDAVMPTVPKLIMQPYQIDSFANYPNTNFFRLKLKENDTYNWTPNSPIRMYFCGSDHSVSPLNTQVAYQHFIQNGATMVDTMDVDPTLDHYPCAQFAVLYGSSWLQTFAYKPLGSNGVNVVNSTSASSPNGTATESPMQGNPPYSYNWSTGDTTATASGLTAGTYYVTITDKSMCTFTDSAVVQLINGLQDQVLTNVRVYPNPSKGIVTIDNTDPSDVIRQTEVYDMQGRLVKVYTIPQGSSTQLYFAQSAPGVYYLHLKAESGKEVRTKLTILNQ